MVDGSEKKRIYLLCEDEFTKQFFDYFLFKYLELNEHKWGVDYPKPTGGKRGMASAIIAESVNTPSLIILVVDSDDNYEESFKEIKGIVKSANQKTKRDDKYLVPEQPYDIKSLKKIGKSADSILIFVLIIPKGDQGGMETLLLKSCNEIWNEEEKLDAYIGNAFSTNSVTIANQDKKKFRMQLERNMKPTADAKQLWNKYYDEIKPFSLDHPCFSEIKKALIEIDKAVD